MNKALDEEDEELAYVYLMKYFQLITLLKKAKDFKREEQYIRKVLGRNSDITERMDRLRDIQRSLNARYDERHVNSMAAIPANNANNNKNVSSGPIPTVNPKDTSSEHNKSMKHSKSIECGELYKLMSDKSVSMLIMDCRLSEDFNASQLKYKNLLNVPEEIIKKG